MTTAKASPIYSGAILHIDCEVTVNFMAVLCYATNLYDVAIVNCFARWRNNYILVREFPLVR